MSKYRSIKTGTQGFTLVELSIVIIIIGFLIAGIAAGTSLIKQAELNSVVTDFQSYQTAYNNFLGRYSKAPGDFNAAASIWGAANIEAPNPPITGNGDGNNKIDDYREARLAWKHLSLAGMISSGIAVVSDGGIPKPGTDVPASKVNGGGFMMVMADTSVLSSLGTSNLWNDDATNAVFLGKPNTANGILSNGAITAEDAFNIDRKLDDGQTDSTGAFLGAGTGSVRTFEGLDVTAGDCIVEGTTGTDIAYAVSSTVSACGIGIALN